MLRGRTKRSRGREQLDAWASSPLIPESGMSDAEARSSAHGAALRQGLERTAPAKTRWAHSTREGAAQGHDELKCATRRARSHNMSRTAQTPPQILTQHEHQKILRATRRLAAISATRWRRRSVTLAQKWAEPADGRTREGQQAIPCRDGRMLRTRIGHDSAQQELMERRLSMEEATSSQQDASANQLAGAPMPRPGGQKGEGNGGDRGMSPQERVEAMPRSGKQQSQLSRARGNDGAASRAHEFDPTEARRRGRMSMGEP